MMSKRNAVCLLVGVALMVLFSGCASINTKNVDAFTTLIDKLDARGSGIVDDPSLKFFVYHESGVGVRIDGIHAQGSGQGTPSDDEVKE